MYEKDFFERLNLQQLCAFLRTGGRLSPKAVEHGTLWERIRRAEDAWEAAMKAYRDKILTTDWSDLPPRGEAAVLEELQGGIMDAECRLESLYFEAGFHAGIRIGWELAAAQEALTCCAPLSRYNSSSSSPSWPLASMAAMAWS